MPVSDVMTTRLITVEPDVTAADAVRRMVDANVGSVVVVEGSRLAGIFTERDVLRLVSEGVDVEATPVGDVMTGDVITLGPDDDVVAAAHLMADRRIRHAPVVQGDHLLGVVGIRDVLRVLVELAYERHDPDAHGTARDLLGSPRVSSVTP